MSAALQSAWYSSDYHHNITCGYGSLIGYNIVLIIRAILPTNRTSRVKGNLIKCGYIVEADRKALHIYLLPPVLTFTT